MSQHIEYQRFKRGETCTEEACRARKFYIEDGKKFCQRGHEQAGFRQTQQDEDDWNAQGKKSRKKREEKEKVETMLSGSEARELYLQCYQLILWTQCHWLVTVKGFPAELETIVRDLWSLRLSLVHKKDDQSGYGSGTGTTLFSSASERETSDSEGAGGKSVGSSRSRKSVASEERLPRLVETLALCYMGILLKRIPVSLGDIYAWATREEIVYTRAISEIPKEMRTKLPGHFHSALEMKSVLKGATLHGAVLDLMEFYGFHFELICPALNAPNLIFKHIRDLGLPIETYPAVHRLAELLDIDFSWPVTIKRAHGISGFPEIQIMSLIVIATKLTSPFDDIPRVPETASEPSTIRIDWAKWMRIMATEPPPGLQRGEEVKVVDIDVWNMDAKKMDNYLDWYQRTWLDDRDSKVPEQMLQLFPLETLKPRPSVQDSSKGNVTKLKEVQNTLLVQKSQHPGDRTAKDPIRPGELYKRYRTIDELPDTAKAFYEMAASKIGISLNMLVKAVFKYEVKVGNWVVADKRRENAGDNVSIEEED